MKFTIAAIVLLVAYLLISKTGNALEENHYTLIKKLDNIEIRKYKDLIYTTYTPKNLADRDNSFRNVADFIFGNNSKQEKIAMTTPVVIKLHNKNEMAFIMPEKYDMQTLPKPNNTSLDIYTEKGEIKACIEYSGYSNEKIEKRKITELKNILNKHNIEFLNDFEVLVYNSPWKVINRKNEIRVTIKYDKMNEKENKQLNKVYFGGGCFWCVEAIFEDVNGVTNVMSGYSGGKIKNPSYKEVSRGLTKHAEVCEISYDSNKINLVELLEIFFLSHDPTTLNRQGNDVGEHYRSIILYNNEKEKIEISNYMNKINEELFDGKITTELKKFEKFYVAESYHQNYYKQNSSAGYCKMVITPKVNKARKELSKYY